MGDSYTKWLQRRKKESAFMKKVRECGGFDIEHLMETKPICCNLWAFEFTEDQIAPDYIFLYARLGIHKYNMMKGTNLQLHGIEKYNVYRKVPYSINFVTAVAMDPSAGGSLIPFQTSFYEEGMDMDIKRLSCFIARPKPEPHFKEEDRAFNLQIQSESEPIDKGRLPEWSEDAFDDKKHYYLVKESELVKNDWIHLYLELAFLTANISLEDIDLSKLVIIKVVMYTSDENMVVPNKRLNARNAVFFIKYKYMDDGCDPTRDRIAVVRRQMDKISGQITLSYSWRNTFL